MYEGYIEFGGVELLNSARTEAYALHVGASWFRGCAECSDMSAGLGDAPYTSPLQDSAPWVDPDNPDTWRFWGFYPLDIQGFDNSTQVASAIEGIRSGGVVGNRRAATRTMTFHVMLLAADDSAAMSGMAWLRHILDGSGCKSPGAGCGGDDLCFLSSCPPVCTDLNDPTECFSGYWRTFRRVTATSGPTVLQKHTMGDGSAVWELEFEMIAAVPYAYGERRFVGIGGSPIPDYPDVEERAIQPLSTIPPILNMPETECPGPVIPPAIYDPFCPVILAPPTVPTIRPSWCVDLPDHWDRYSLQVPDAMVPANGIAIPSITIRAGLEDMRMIRVRFYGDPLSWFDPQDLDPCAFCGEFLVTYLKAQHEIVLDGMDESIVMRDPNNIAATSVNASSVVTSTDDTGFVWPELTCGMGYIMTIDLPAFTTLSTAGASLSLNVRTAA